MCTVSSHALTGAFVFLPSDIWPFSKLWLDGLKGRGLAVNEIFRGYKAVADWPASDFYKARYRIRIANGVVSVSFTASVSF